MSRPIKEGLDYFPHDVNSSNDKKIEALRALYGNDGYAFYFIMLEQIYQEPNGELDVSDAETREEIMQILSKKIAVTNELFLKMLDTAMKWGCFDKQMYTEQGIITSNGIKKRMGVVIEKRQKMRDRYQQRKKEISASETPQNPGRNQAETTPETPQRKGKEIIKESKDKEKDIIMSQAEHEFLSELEQIKDYPLDRTKDLAMYKTLSERYPDVDLVSAVKDWRVYKIDKPLRKKDNPRSQFNNWCSNAQEWGKNKKQAKPPEKDPDRFRDPIPECLERMPIISKEGVIIGWRTEGGEIIE